MDSWPTAIARTNVQQDGAKAHPKPTDEDFNSELEALGSQGKTGLHAQPAQSPDLNVNDLGFFSALQSRHRCATQKNESELIAMVQAAFEDCAMPTLKKLWCALQSATHEMMKTTGNNHFEIPHANEDKLEREGRLPVVLPMELPATCCPEDEQNSATIMVDQSALSVLQ